MKKITFFRCVITCLCVGINSTYAQDSKPTESKMKKRTLLNRFESDYVLTVSERIALKQSRLAHQYRTKEILDSLDLPDRKRNKLLEELKRNPFSDHIQNVIIKETKSEETPKEVTPN